ncbi:AcrR family transcriptional regulator [Angulomicrobium tetraedrale]|uniref:AcrR family transcriptional regulator n=1 Tax=Ancylobacter tetraedralis TaxID=217068 RepID=A0A839Z8C8_9HYPH|nr:TetR/AcrR family transcriptional regulator [Ancylobacter tetraedralis]MBB3770936.1 AcrR family transcriptional regulator [Ancylobacter tetraedralis]
MTAISATRSAATPAIAMAATADAKPARKRLQPAERRAIILQTALKLFAQQHYSIVTVRDIAQACGINVGLLYHYFDNKDDLVRRALGHAIEQLVVSYEARRAAGLEPLAEILAWLDTHIELAATLEQMVKLMADYANSNIRDEEIDGLIAGFYDGEKRVLEGALRRGIEAGRFGPLDVPRVARRIGLMLDGIFYASASRRDDRIEDDIRDLADLVGGMLGVGDGAAAGHRAERRKEP